MRPFLKGNFTLSPWLNVLIWWDFRDEPQFLGGPYLIHLKLLQLILRREWPPSSHGLVLLSFHGGSSTSFNMEEEVLKILQRDSWTSCLVKQKSYRGAQSKWKTVTQQIESSIVLNSRNMMFHQKALHLLIMNCIRFFGFFPFVTTIFLSCELWIYDSHHFHEMEKWHYKYHNFHMIFTSIS